MATILLLGTNTALLEGLAQTLASAGHRGLLARSMSEAIEISSPERPLVAVIERAIAMTDAHRVPLQAGGAMVVYDSERRPIEPMPTAVARATLAELVLPLERQRLLALIQHVVDRSDATGRARRKTPPEQRAI